MSCSGKTVAVFSVVLLVLAGCILPPSSGTTVLSTGGTADQQELVLLRGEHILYFNATVDVEPFNLRYSFPPEYQYQIPIYLELINDTTANIIRYTIDDDTNFPNKVVNFTLADMNESESKMIHFYLWVLVENHDYSDMPEKADMPKRSELPEEVKQWLAPSKVVQSRRILIKLRSKQLRGLRNDLIRYAEKVAKFTKNHRYGLFLLQLYTGLFGPQDAMHTLRRNGECPGRSHLGCALFRTQNVPARVVMATPHYEFWFQMHYMSEYYLPGYGWILTEVHKGNTPVEPKEQIIMRVCYPEDEENTHSDYIFSRMTGLESWFWFDDLRVFPYFVNCTAGSKNNMFVEAETLTDDQTANNAVFTTKLVLNLYQTYQGVNLSSEDQGYFENATYFQKKACEELQQSDVPGYIIFMDTAYDEYKKIADK